MRKIVGFFVGFIVAGIAWSLIKNISVILIVIVALMNIDSPIVLDIANAIGVLIAVFLTILAWVKTYQKIVNKKPKV